MVGFIILMLLMGPYAIYHLYKEFMRFRTQNLQVKWVNKPTKTAKLSTNTGAGAKGKAASSNKPCNCNNKKFLGAVIALLAVTAGIGLWIFGYAIGSN